jgi:hypothetical protein
MSYTPGTKLSHSEMEKATVITQGYLMPTQGKYAGQRMLVADWVILADGATIYEDYIPLGSEAVAPEAIRSEALAPEALEPLPRSQTSSIETETFAHCLHPHSLTPLPRSRTSSVETEACGCEEVVREFLPVPVPAPTPPPTKPRPNYNHVNWPSPMPSLLAQSLGIASQRPTHQRALEMLARRFNCSVEVFLQTNWKQLNLNYSAAELMRKCGNNRYRF